jgi:diaminohydroxyphosphoribosylaminopyrimidine deaminase/5-amino-6-(5-phosphoribosylamino)uracil reductase
MDASQDAVLLARCNQLARLGGRNVFPNPYVGSVVVADGKIIGEGYHQAIGGPHAEVNAIASISDRTLLPSATIYVNLEPCNIHGRTPPCTELILNSGIKRVVIGCRDPNPKVSGKGIQRLREQGIEVTVASDPTPFIELNKRFFVNQLLKRPYITLKWAQSANGHIAGYDQSGNLKAEAITGFEAKCLTHQLRARHQAIMVGRHTATIDDPLLNNRHYYGGQPIRIIPDRHQRLSPELRLLKDGESSWILSEKPYEQPNPMRNKFLSWDPWPLDIEALIRKLYVEEGICSIFIEGGSKLHQQFLDLNLFDELYIFQGSDAIEKGYPAPKLPAGLHWPPVQKLGKDLLWHFSITRFHALMPDRDCE